MSLYSNALEIATEAHSGQFDKAGVDYIQHPLYVASLVSTEKEKAVALLHDVIEDSSVTKEELLLSGIDSEVVEAVSILTKHPNDSYQSYLERVKGNALAKVVKLADLTHNSDLSRLKNITKKDEERFQKYAKAIKYLNSIY